MHDHLRLELEYAMARGIPIVPVLVRGASLPDANELPATLQHLVLYQGVEVRSDRSFKGSVEFLAKGIAAELARQEHAAAARAQAEREAKEGALREAWAAAEREANEAAEREARLTAEREANEAAERGARLTARREESIRNARATEQRAKHQTHPARELMYEPVAAPFEPANEANRQSRRGAWLSATAGATLLFVVAAFWLARSNGSEAPPPESDAASLHVATPLTAAEVFVYSDAADSKLFVNGEDYGALSIDQTRRLQLLPGAYRIEAKKDGVTTVVRIVTVSPDARAMEVFLMTNAAQAPSSLVPEQQPAAAEEPAEEAEPAPSQEVAKAQPATSRSSRTVRKDDPSPSDRSPIELASACLARGDNSCVVKALEGHAETAQEIGLLIETYRAMGNDPKALKHMGTYVQRFPTARRAETYRLMLERGSTH